MYFFEKTGYENQFTICEKWLLRQAPGNRIRRLRGIQALLPLLENSFGHRSVPGCMEQMTAVLADVLNSVPVYELACTPDERAVALLEATLQQEGPVD